MFVIQQGTTITTTAKQKKKNSREKRKYKQKTNVEKHAIQFHCISKINRKKNSLCAENIETKKKSHMKNTSSHTKQRHLNIYHKFLIIYLSLSLYFQIISNCFYLCFVAHKIGSSFKQK